MDHRALQLAYQHRVLHVQSYMLQRLQPTQLDRCTVTVSHLIILHQQLYMMLQEVFISQLEQLMQQKGLLQEGVASTEQQRKAKIKDFTFGNE